jgi:hypothetical protein
MNLNLLRGHVDILQFVKTRRAEIDLMEERARAAIEEAMGEDEIGEVDGKIVVTWRHNKSRRFNQKQHKEDQPACHESFMQTSEGRTFKVEQ